MTEKSIEALSKQGIKALEVSRDDTKKVQVTEIVNNLKFSQKSSSYLFRGLSDSRYDLSPSISRPRHFKRLFEFPDEKIVFKAIKTEGMMFLEREDLSDIDLLALAQHFGCPTRLLDWTTNPLVSLYFSTFSGKNIDESRDGIVYIYRSQSTDYLRSKYELNVMDDERPLFPQSIFKDISLRFIFPRFVDSRIINQKGLFSIQADPSKTFSEHCDKSRLTYIIIPKEMKVELASYLHGFGISHDFIMPGFNGFCENLSYRYKYNVGIRSQNLDSKE